MCDTMQLYAMQTLSSPKCVLGFPNWIDNHITTSVWTHSLTQCESAESNRILSYKNSTSILRRFSNSTVAKMRLVYNCSSSFFLHSFGPSKPDLFCSARYNLAAIFKNGYIFFPVCSFQVNSIKNGCRFPACLTFKWKMGRHYEESTHSCWYDRIKNVIPLDDASGCNGYVGDATAHWYLTTASAVCGSFWDLSTTGTNF